MLWIKDRLWEEEEEEDGDRGVGIQKGEEE